MKYINYFSTQSEYDNAKLSYPNVSYVEETEKVLLVESRVQKNNEIWYTSTDGQIVTPRNVGTIVSNTYEDGQGVITFASDVTSIGNYAFAGSSILTSIEIPSSVTSIGIYAFGGCTSLTSIDIPSGVTSISANAFEGCSSLTSIGIPNGVTNIESGTFGHCSGLTSVNIPSNVTSIGGSAFFNCTSLTSIEIPSGVTSIGYDTFYGCSGLTSITYNGTSTQFTSITKGSTWKYGVPDTCIVHCTDGDFPITQFN